MTAERRLAKIEESLSPTELVLHWLEEAHRYDDQARPSSHERRIRSRVIWLGSRNALTATSRISWDREQPPIGSL